MNVLIAPDSFKECMDAFAVAEALSVGIYAGASGTTSVQCRPLADGGEGMLQVLHFALGGEIRNFQVSGPLGEPVTASLGLLDNGETAVIEMAQAAGLHLVPPSLRNPNITSTRGVGELMRHALDLGVKRIIIGLGGSATNDGGAGMAQALGVSLKDKNGNELPGGGLALAELAVLDVTRLAKQLAVVDVIAACDVRNALCGPEGASYVYGPQKGAAPEDVLLLDKALEHYALIIKKHLDRDIRILERGGAAGGLAAGLVAFAGATCCSGIDLVLDAYSDMETLIQWADFIVTGEGSVDGQSLQGKAAMGLAQKAKRVNKPVVLIAGQVHGDMSPLYETGVTAVFPIAQGPCTLEISVQNAPLHIQRTAENIMRWAETMLR